MKGRGEWCSSGFLLVPRVCDKSVIWGRLDPSRKAEHATDRSLIDGYVLTP